MKLIEHYVGGKVIPGNSDRKTKIFNPATGEQESEVKLASKTDLDQAVEVAKKAGCKNSMLMYFEKEIPMKELKNSNIIGISSGASAPEQLVQNLLNEVKKDREITIEEVIVAEEKVVFKLPKELN